MPRARDLTDPIDLFVGERLRAVRLSRGLSQSGLGAAMRLSFQQIQKYERGTNRVSASMLMRAAKALGVPVADFFPDSGIDASPHESVDIRALRGGAALAEYFQAMDATQRVVLLQVAQEFARMPKDSRAAA